jgi:hypothetical protein
MNLPSAYSLAAGVLDARKTAHELPRGSFLFCIIKNFFEAWARLGRPFFVLFLGFLSCKNNKGEEIPSNDIVHVMQDVDVSVPNCS